MIFFLLFCNDAQKIAVERFDILRAFSQDDAKLIAAIAETLAMTGINLPNCGAYGLQSIVAEGVPVGVVDRFEFIHVEKATMHGLSMFKI